MGATRQTPKQYVLSVADDAELRYRPRNKPFRVGLPFLVARTGDNKILGFGYTAPAAWRNAQEWVRQNIEKGV